MTDRSSTHLVLLTRHRSKIISDRVRDDLIKVVADICARHAVIAEYMRVGDDFLHAKLSYPPDLSVPRLVALIKSQTTKSVRASDYPEVRDAVSQGEFWEPSYFLYSGSGDAEEKVKRFLERQRNADTETPD